SGASCPTRLGEKPPVTMRPTPPSARSAKISGKFVDVPEPVFQAGVHGAHQHPVFQFSKTEIEGFQQVGVACGHEALTNNIYPEYTLDQWQVDLTFRTGHVSSVFKFD